MKVLIICQVLFLLPLLAWAELPKLIKVCDDGEEWPPYAYYERVEGKKSQNIVGYSVDLLKEIVAAKDIQISVELIPWSKCLNDLHEGKYDMTLNAGFNSERNHSYLMSRAFYTVTPVYFFDNSKKPPLLESVTDLKKYKLCGVKGYNYRAGFMLDKNSIDLTSTSIMQAFQGIKSGKCDLVPERLEPVVGYKIIKIYDYEADGISYRVIPRMEPVTFHMMVSKKISYSKELFEMINQGIKDLEHSEKNNALLKKYSIINSHN